MTDEDKKQKSTSGWVSASAPIRKEFLELYQKEQERLLVAKVEAALEGHKHEYAATADLSNPNYLEEGCVYCGVTRRENADETYRQLMAKRWEKK